MIHKSPCHSNLHVCNYVSYITYHRYIEMFGGITPQSSPFCSVDRYSFEQDQNWMPEKRNKNVAVLLVDTCHIYVSPSHSFYIYIPNFYALSIYLSIYIYISICEGVQKYMIYFLRWRVHSCCNTIGPCCNSCHETYHYDNIRPFSYYIDVNS